MLKSFENNRGFTVLELLVVLAVMGVMIGALGFSFIGANQSGLGDAQRSVLSLLQKARVLAVSNSVESRILVSADIDDSEKYLRQAKLVILDQNNSNHWQIVEDNFYLPQDTWFVGGDLTPDLPEWPSDAKCSWSFNEQEEEFRLTPVKSTSGGRDIKALEQSADGLRYFYVSCNPSGHFVSNAFPKMPRLVFALGKLMPNSSGILVPVFSDSKALAGLQIQPFGGLLSLEYQDFGYDQ